MFLFVYMYHSYVSIIHLTWILTTFLVSIETTLLISIYAMIPILSWEFIFVYGIRIPIVQELDFFKTYGNYFQWAMEKKSLEQSLMFLTLACFYMMLSCKFILDK